MRKSTYRSCNCKACRLSGKDKDWKKAPHKKLRREEKEAIRKGEDPPQDVSGDYRA